MADQADENPGLLSSGHPAVRTRKTPSTRKNKSPTKPTAEQRRVSLSLFERPEPQGFIGLAERPRGDQSFQNSNAPPPVPKQYAVDSFMPVQEQEGDFLDLRDQAAAEDQRTEEGPEREKFDERRPMKGYSNETWGYHAQYAEVSCAHHICRDRGVSTVSLISYVPRANPIRKSQAHDQGRGEICREGCCLNLLTESRPPRYTRIQILQMASTLFHPNTAENMLQEAATILQATDQSCHKVQALTEDDELMLVDLQTWRAQKGDRMEVDGETRDDADNDDDEEPSDAYLASNRNVQERLSRLSWRKSSSMWASNREGR